MDRHDESMTSTSVPDAPLDISKPVTPSLAVTALTDASGDVHHDGDTWGGEGGKLQGVGAPNSLVQFYVDGQPKGGVYTDATGHWQITMASYFGQGGVTEGKHTITLKDTKGVSSEPFEYTVAHAGTAPVDVVAPVAPQPVEPVTPSLGVTALTDASGVHHHGDTLGGEGGKLEGVGAPNSLVQFYVDGQPKGGVYTDATGHWQITMASYFGQSGVTEGKHTITVKDTKGVSSEPFEYTVSHAPTAPVDAIEPVAPSQPAEPVTPSLAVMALTDAIGDVHHHGDTCSSAGGKLEGVGAPNSLVQFYVDGQPKGGVYTDATGHWQITMASYFGQSGVAEGTHTITVKDTKGVSSEPFEYTVPKTPPPAITSITDTSGMHANGEALSDHISLIQGDAEPGSMLKLYVDGVYQGGVSADTSGHWTFKNAPYSDFQSSDLAEGKHVITVVNQWTGVSSDPFEFIVPHTLAPWAPPQPTITAFVDASGEHHNGDVSGDRIMSIRGDAEPGSILQLYVDGIYRGEAYTDTSGHWQIKNAPFTEVEWSDLAEGKHVITMVNRNTGASSDPFEFIVSHAGNPPIDPPVDPVAPTLAVTGIVDASGSHQSGDEWNGDSTHAVIQGTATPGASITIYIDGISFGMVRATADESGHWEVKADFLTAQDLTDGSHTIIVRDGQGATSEPFEYIVSHGDTAPIDPPVDPVTPTLAVTGIVDASGTHHNGEVWSGDAFNSVLQGVAEPGTLVRIFIDGIGIGATTVDKSGEWTISVFPYFDEANLTDGQHVIEVQNGNATSEPFYYTVSHDSSVPVDPIDPAHPTDPVAPVEPRDPVIEHVYDSHGYELTSGASTEDPRPTITGSGGVPGETLFIMFDDAKHGATEIGRTTVQPDGTWSVQLSVDLLPGEHSGFYAWSNADHVIRQSPTFELHEQGSSSSDTPASVTAITDANGSHQNGGTWSNDSGATLQGVAASCGQVTIFVDGARVGTASADESGHWEIEVAPYFQGDELTEGKHTIILIDQDGVASQPFEYIVSHGDTAPIDPPVDPVAPTLAVTGIVDNSGTHHNGDVWNGDSVNSVLQGVAEPGTLVRIFVDGIGIGATTVDKSGEWTISVFAYFDPSNLTEGQHVIEVQDGEANSEPFYYTVSHDSSVPVEPIDPVTPTLEVTAIVDEAGTHHNGEAWTGFPGATLEGTAAPNSIVKIIVDGKDHGTVTADASGHWSTNVLAQLGPDGLAIGSHSIVLESGGQSSEPFAYTVSPSGTVPVDPVEPAALVIEHVYDAKGHELANGETTTDPRPTVTGSGGVPGSTVEIVYNNPDHVAITLGSAIVQSDGGWSLQLNADLPQGEHSGFYARYVADGTLVKSVPFELDEHGVTQSATPPSVTSIVDADGVHHDGQAWNGDYALLQGVAQPGSGLNILLDGVAVGSARTDDAGHWQIDTSVLFGDINLAAGKHSIVLLGYDGVGSQPFEFVLSQDVLVPTRPVDPGQPAITAILDPNGPHLNGDTWDGHNGVLQGVASHGAVNIYVDGEWQCVTYPDLSGRWEIHLDTQFNSDSLAAGHHVITIRDSQGVESQPFEYDIPQSGTAPVDPIDPPVIDPPVDPTQPGMDVPVDPSKPVTNPVIEHVYDSHGYELTSGASTDDPRPTVTGSGGQPGATVYIVYSDPSRTTYTVLGQAIVQADGNWSVQFSADLLQGEHSSFYALLSDGTHDFQSAPFELNEHGASSSPTPPVVTSISDAGGEYHNGDVWGGEAAVIRGEATPNSLVNVFVDGSQHGNMWVDESGHWQITTDAYFLPGNLADGKHTITIVDANGVASQPFEYTVSHGDTAPIDPPVDPVAPTLAVTGIVDNSGTHHNGEVWNGDAFNSVLQGVAEPGTLVRIFIDGIGIGATTVDKSGEWTISVFPYFDEANLTNGQHVIEVQNGNATSEPFYYTVSHDGTVPVDPIDPVTPMLEVTAIVDEAGAHHNGEAWTGFPGATLEGTAAPNSVVKILVDGKDHGTVTADASGHWSTNVLAQLGSDGLAIGSHSIVLESGGQSSEPFAYTVSPSGTVPVDPVEPAALVIEHVYDAKDHELANGETTTDPRPTVTGSGGQPGATVHIVYGDPKGSFTELGSAIINADGTWSVTFNADLLQGEHSSFYALVTDGQNDYTSPLFELNEQGSSSAANPPKVTSIEDASGQHHSGDTWNGDSAVVHGTAVPSCVLNIFVDGALVGTTRVDASGQWQISTDAYLPGNLADGKHTITILDQDGVASQPFTYVVAHDTAPVEPTQPVEPVVPTITSISDAAGQHHSGDTWTGDKAVIEGMAAPHTILDIVVDGIHQGYVTSDETGYWQIVTEGFLSRPSLAEGDHTIVVKDQFGLASQPFEYIVPPAMPIATAITAIVDDNGQHHNGDVWTGDVNYSVIEGTATPNSQVVLLIDGIGRTGLRADASGHWSINTSLILQQDQLAPGTHVIVVATADLHDASQPFFVYVSPDGTPPAGSIIPTQPVTAAISAIVDASGDHHSGDTVVSPNDVTIEGVGTPGSQLRLVVDGKPSDYIFADASGHWQISGSMLANYPDAGQHTIAVIDANGVQSQPFEYVVSHDTAPVEPVDPVDPVNPVDPTQPVADVPVDPAKPVTNPVIEHVFDYLGRELGQGQLTTDPRPTVFGSGGQPGATVYIVYKDAQSNTFSVLGQAIVQPDGTWTVKFGADLLQGEHSGFYALLSDGHNDYTSEPFDLNERGFSTPASPLAVSTIADAEGNHHNGGTWTGESATIQGVGAPSTTLQIFIDGHQQGSVFTDASGHWQISTDAYLLPGNLTSGTHTITVVDATGVASQPFTYVVAHDTAPVEPVEPTQPVEPVQVTLSVVDRSSGSEHEVANGGVSHDFNPLLQGHTVAFAEVTITDQLTNKVIGTTQADADGHWKLSTDILADGHYQLVASTYYYSSEPFSLDVANTHGNPLDLAALPPTHGSVTVDVVIDRSGDQVRLVEKGGVAHEGDGHETYMLVAGRADPGASVNLFDYSKGYLDFVGSAKADANGVWQTNVIKNLEHYEFIAAKLQWLPDWDLGTYNVDVVPHAQAQPSEPLPLAITAAYDHEGMRASGAVSDTGLPVLTGTATPCYLVEVYDNGQPLGITVSVDVNGHWAIDQNTWNVYAQHLEPGQHSLTIGFDGQMSEPFVITVPAAQANSLGMMEVEASSAHHDILVDGGDSVHTAQADHASPVGLHDVLSSSDADLFTASQPEHSGDAKLSVADVESQMAEAPASVSQAPADVSSADMTALQNQLLPQEQLHHA